MDSGEGLKVSFNAITLFCNITEEEQDGESQKGFASQGLRHVGNECHLGDVEQVSSAKYNANKSSVPRIKNLKSKNTQHANIYLITGYSEQIQFKFIFIDCLLLFFFSLFQ